MFAGELRAFYEAVRSGSVRKAGERLGLAPSSVSRQILILERHIGAELFERSATGVSLTRAGKLVADYARSMLLDYDSLRVDVDELKGLKKGVIRIASIEGAALEQATTAVLSFRKRFEGVSFQLDVRRAAQVAEAIKLGETDIGLTFCGEVDAELKFESRIPDPIVLAVSPLHELACANRVQLVQLQSLPLALPDAKSSIYQIVDRAIREAGYLLTPALSTNSIAALKAFARDGRGAALMSRLSVKADEQQGRLRWLPFEPDALQATTIDVITLRRRRMSAAMKLFLVELQRTMDGVVEPPAPARTEKWAPSRSLALAQARQRA